MFNCDFDKTVLSVSYRAKTLKIYPKFDTFSNVFTRKSLATKDISFKLAEKLSIYIFHESGSILLQQDRF